MGKDLSVWTRIKIQGSVSYTTYLDVTLKCIQNGSQCYNATKYDAHIAAEMGVFILMWCCYSISVSESS